MLYDGDNACNISNGGASGAGQADLQSSDVVYPSDRNRSTLPTHDTHDERRWVFHQNHWGGWPPTFER